MELTEKQWEVVKDLIPESPKRSDGKGRPRRSSRDVLNGILWVLRTGAPWKDIPSRYPPYQTCHRRFQEWTKQGLFKEIVAQLALDLYKRGKLDLTEGAIDGTFSGAKKGAQTWAKQRKGRVQRSWQLQTALVFLSPCTWPALRHMKLNLLKTP